MSRRPRGENHYLWKGGRSFLKSGYIEIKLQDGRRIYEHRHVMEQEIGRKLKRNEIVHHINGNKHDNRIENLELMSNSEHTKHHWDENAFGDRETLVERFSIQKKPKKKISEEEKAFLSQERKKKKLERDRNRYWLKRDEILKKRSLWNREDKEKNGVFQKRREVFEAKAKAKGLTPEAYRAVLDKHAKAQRNWRAKQKYKST